MNYIDLLLVLVLLLSVWAAVQRGFIISILSLAVWLGSLIAGFILYPPISVFFQRYISALGTWSTPLAFIIVVISFRLLLDMLANRIINRTEPQVHDHPANKFLGILPGLADGFVWTALLATFLMLLPISQKITKEAQDSKLARGLVDKVSWLENKLSPVFGDVLNRPVSKMTTGNTHEESVKLPYKVKSPKVREDLEAEMLDMVNKERAENGLNPLRADPELTAVARKHSVDMFARGYFSHISPEGTDPFDRMRRDKVRFLTAGENLALAQTLFIAHNGLMNSPGHRANILNPNFGRLGIGVMDGGIYGLMITQNFRN